MIDETVPMQCSMGIVQLKSGKWKFNVIFFFPNTPDGTFTEEVTLADRFNYFESKTSFKSDIESSLYGNLICEGLHHAMVDLRDHEYAFSMIEAVMDKLECPDIAKKEIEKFYLESPPNEENVVDLSDDDKEMLN